MQRIPNASYHPGLLRFDFENGGLSHNIADDYTLFALWQDARPFEQRIRDALSDRFDIVLDGEIRWSERNFHWNACRLYETPFQTPTDRVGRKRGHLAKIGSPHFRVFVVRDPEPDYRYEPSASGKIAPVNVAVTALKAEFRSWIDARYRVHSSNNISEFYTQAALLLGPQVIDGLHSGTRYIDTVFEQDAQGADGWSSWREALEVLRWSVDYLVLRNFEDDDLARSGDVDFLCRDFQALCSSLGLRQLLDRGAPFKGRVDVAGAEVPIDVRSCGDGYFDRAWQMDVLARKIAPGHFFQPREDDHYFTLLYHALVHKPEIKRAYRDFLSSAGGGLSNVAGRASDGDPRALAAILAGYMRACGYCFEVPKDRKVGQNRAIIKLLPKGADRPSRWKRKLARLLKR